MQPAQLSLIPEQGSMPPPDLTVDFPHPEVTEAIKMLARLIAKVAAAATVGGSGDE
ncbi:MAG: hypothetical protein ACM3ML_12630 [Micromonosporaceae bacterium]